MKQIFRTLLIVAIVSFVACNKLTDPTKMYQIEKDGLYGFIDVDGNVVVEPQYICTSYRFNKSSEMAVVVLDTVTKSSSGLFGILQIDTFFVRYNYIKTNGEKAFKHDFEDCIPLSKDEICNAKYMLSKFCNEHLFVKGLAVVADTNTWRKGYMNKHGKIVIPCIYTEATTFSDSTAAVRKRINGSNNWGIIDMEGHEICDFIYSDISIIKENRAFAYIIYSSMKYGTDTLDGEFVKDENGKTRIDRSKHTLINRQESGDPEYGSAYYLIDGRGNIIKQLSIGHFGKMFNDGIAVMTPNFLGEFLGFRYLFIDKNGNFLTGISEEDLDSVANNLSEKEINNILFGIEEGDDDYNGFPEALPFSEGYSGVRINDQAWVFIDKNLLGWGHDGEPYEYCGLFCFGLAPVKINGKWGYVDTTLTIAIPCQYDFCFPATGKDLCKVYTSKSDDIKIVSYIRRDGSIVWQNKIISSISNQNKKPKPLSEWAKRKLKR